MNSVTCQISVSLDGFVAGPNQSLEHPLGEGGMRLHEWAFANATFRRAHGLDGGDEGPDSEVVEEAVAGVGAYIMGRNMFGGGDGPWDPSWTGWWGGNPPFHVPVFVLTHHARDPLGMDGGAATVQQFLAAGLLDELYLHIVPVILSAGERLLETVGNPSFEPVKVV